MKTGAVQDRGNGTPYLETDGWSAWLYHAYEAELEPYYRAANALMMKLERMPPAVRARLKRIEIRCPVKGCLLATVYWMPRRPTAEELERDRRENARGAANGWPLWPASQPGDYLYIGRTADGTEVYDLLFFGFSRTYRDKIRGCTCCRVVYWRAGCRHGTASLDRLQTHELFAVAGREVHWTQTEEQTVASLPEHLRPFWGKRVFHPEPAAWHPKKRQRPGHAQHSRPLQISDPVGGRR